MAFATAFTPYEALIGGLLIGTASVLLMAGLGRIAGITGIVGGLLPPGFASDWGWRLAFVIGMIASPFVYTNVTGQAVSFQSLDSSPVLLASGLIVGIGVTFGSGCTSGHGVCGLGRFSVRSLAATLMFMATAVVAVYVVRHVVGG